MHTSTISGCHLSRDTDFTLEICVPIFLWIPEQRIQTKIPKLTLAQRGPKEKTKIERKVKKKKKKKKECVKNNTFLSTISTIVVPWKFKNLL